jgi:ATP phosphoribosyltransferase regulatory subunit HisZ
LPDFLHIFLEDAAIKNQQILKKAILQKNLSEIKRICPEYSDILSKIVRCQDNLTNLSDLITAKINSNKIQFELNRAKQIESFFAKKYNKIPIIFDLFGDQDIKYHQDIYFEIFVPRFSYSIARGGRYNIAISDKNIKAIGSTIYLNNLRKINAPYNS